jgi:hypothetical protein
MMPHERQPEGVARKEAQTLDGKEGSARLRWEMAAPGLRQHWGCKTRAQRLVGRGELAQSGGSGGETSQQRPRSCDLAERPMQMGYWTPHGGCGGGTNGTRGTEESKKGGDCVT